MGDDICEHDGLLRFRVALEQGLVEAFVSRAACHAGTAHGAAPRDLTDFYRRHRLPLEQIVAAKLRDGARRPVVLSAHDLLPLGLGRAQASRPAAAQPVAVQSSTAAPV